MKQIVIFLIVMSCVVAVGTVAQTQGAAKADNTMEKEKSPDVNAEQTLPDSAASNVPRAYPIAPGIWYPGEPLPEKPFRYYRIRCWPGCHHNSEYGMYSDKSKKEETVNITDGADKK